MIQSSLVTAEVIATHMGNASDAIERAVSKPIVKAEKTTLAVNGMAQEAIKLTQLFNQSFLKTIENLRSVAKNFEYTDGFFLCWIDRTKIKY